MIVINDNYGQPWGFTGNMIISLVGDDSYKCNSLEEGIGILTYEGFLGDPEYEESYEDNYGLE